MKKNIIAIIAKKNCFSLKSPVKTRLLIIFFILFTALLFITPNTEAYNFINDSGLNKTGMEAGYSDSTKEPEIIIGQVIQAILSLLGVVFLGLMIFAGITWLTAQGDEQKALKAKKIIEESISGIVIVLAAYAITYFVINYFINSN